MPIASGDKPTERAMDLLWKFSAEDISRVKALIERHSANPLVRDRAAVNLSPVRPSVGRDNFWRQMVYARLTTQQKSGPMSHVAQFMRHNPWPLSLSEVENAPHTNDFISNVLADATGLRFKDKIARELARNFERLKNGEWSNTLARCNSLMQHTDQASECRIADYIDDTFDGFGPKQARNLLQMLGLTRHEIPIDSRVIAWMNESMESFRLSATALACREYYGLVSNGIQSLCEDAEVVPCIFDASVFVEKDGDGWTEENILQ